MDGFCFWGAFDQIQPCQHCVNKRALLNVTLHRLSRFEGLTAKPLGVCIQLLALMIHVAESNVPKPLFDASLSVERIKAARKAIDADNSGVLLTGRCEAILRGINDLNLVIERLQAYAAAGADCLYAPGIKTNEEIAAVVKAVHPKPVNLLIGFSEISLKQAEGLGVRRISVGGSLARNAWAGFMKAAKEMANSGTFTDFANGYPGGELNKMFG